ncbi:asparaginase [Streptosporangium sp. NPDC000396]|uniref:asparaginase n=1 Tax=Streptosporangium sp. NPDC000396 TaxID=3366185 RepID=UPI0036853D21
MASHVLLLATKDTIAYTRRDDRLAIASGTDLLDGVPADQLAADVTVEDVTAEPSWDMSPATMLALARRVRSAVLDDGFDGVVVTHGTDTLEETAFLADLLAGPAASRGGIVFTGAMRRLDELSADGPRNLAASIAAAADPRLRQAGAVVCVNDELHAARWVTKVDATGVAAFSSAPFPPLGRVVAGRVETLGTAPPRPPAPQGEPESDVALIKTYPGIDAALLTAAVDAGARGVVLEGTGMANVPVSLFTAISELTEWGIPVVVASRCRTRDVALEDMRSGTYGLAAGVGAIGARGLAAAKARIALMVALGTGSAEGVRAWFDGL